MNILQITNTACTDTNQPTGVNRMVTQLSDYLSCLHQDNCFLAFLTEDGTVSSLFKSSLHLTNPLDVRKFESFLLSHRIDVILFNFAADQMLGILKDVCMIARNHGIKVVYCHHFMPGFEGCSHGSIEEVWYGILTRNDLFDKLKKWLIAIAKPISTSFIQKLLKGKYETAYLECNKVVVFSESYIDEFLHIVRGDRREKFAAIHNPLSFSEFLSEELLQTKRKEVICVGRFQEPQKRLSAALKIWRLVEQNPLLDEWTLSIVGSGKDEPFYRWLAEKYQLKRVSFDGRQDPKPYYRRASIMMSTAAYEGWPMVLMEAMPMGCCCLGFDSYDAIHDIIEDGENGSIIPDNDIRGYYQALSDLMQDENKRISMGKSAIESSKRFSMEIVGEKWRSVLVG